MVTVALSLALALQAAGPTPEYSRLNNGLRLVTLEDHSLPLVSVQLWYRVGSTADSSERPGPCHIARAVLEHRDDAALRLRAAGVRFESRTFRDACCFASVLPADLLEHVLSIEAGRMAPRPVDAAELQTARQAAARSFGLEPNREWLRNRRLVLAGAFPDQPCRHPPGLVAAACGRLSVEDMDEFLGRWFVPGNATLLVIGDIQPVQVKKLVHEHFAALPWGESPRRHQESTDAEPGTIRLSPAPSGRAGLIMAWALPRTSTFEQLAIDVLMHRLTNPIDGLLDARLREAACVHRGWEHERWRNAGLLLLSMDWEDEAADNSDRVATIERVVRAALEQAVQTPATPIELNRARALAERDWVQRRRAFAQRSLDLGRHELVGGDLLLAEFERAALSRVHVADLQQAAAGLLASRCVVLPRVFAPRVATQPAADGSDLLPMLPARPAQPIDAAEALALLHRHAAGVPPLTQARPPATLSRESLGDGLRVAVCALPGVEPAVVRTLVDRGGFLGWAAAALTAVGSERRSVDEYRDYLAYHGLDLFAVSDARYGLTSRGPGEHVFQMIELQADLIRRPDTSEATRDAAFERLHSVVGLREGWPPAFDREEYYLACGLTGWRLEALFQPLRRAQVTQQLRSLEKLDAVEVIVVGDVRCDEVIEAVRAAWGDWAPAALEMQEKTATTRPAGRDEPLTLVGWGTDEWIPAALLVNDELYASRTESSLHDLALSWAGCVNAAGLLRGSALDATREWRWHWFFVEDDWISYRWLPAPDDNLVAAVKTHLERVTQMQRGALPAAHVAIALRQARIDRLLSLDSTDAIAAALQRGIKAPWDLHMSVDPSAIAELAADIYQVETRSIGGEGPVNREPELSSFRTTFRRRDP